MEIISSQNKLLTQKQIWTVCDKDMNTDIKNVIS